MIFGFGKRRAEPAGEDDEQEIDEYEDLEYVEFKGAMDGSEPDLKANARLVDAGLIAAKELITDGLLRRAERIRLEPKGERAGIILYIDGVAYPGGKLSKQRAMAVTQMLKLLAGLDIRERKKPQAAGLRAQHGDTKYELRIETIGAEGGSERLIVSIRNLKQSLEKPEDLGFSEVIKGKIREWAYQRKGVTLVCGPPFSGTTTTAYAVVRTIDAYIQSVYTIADLGGRELVNVTPFKRHPGEDFDTTVTRLVRMEADVLFLDPIRDAERAREVFEHHDKLNFVAEFAAKDAPSGLLQVVQWIGLEMAAEGLNGIISQKLIRTLCPKCREAYKPNPKILAKLGLPPETKLLYRQARPVEPERGEEPEVCEKCGGLGYYGRAGMYEFIEMTPGMKELVASGADLASIRAQMRKEGMQTLQVEALRLVAEGQTSMEELQRAFKSS